MNDRWLQIMIALAKQHSAKGLRCPLCGQADLDFQYVGDPSTRVCYLPIWCGSCLKGISVSDAEAPSWAGVMPAEALDDIRARIPAFEILEER